MSAAGSCVAGWRVASSWCALATRAKNEIHACAAAPAAGQAAVL